MADTKLKSANHKQIIVQLMGELFSKATNPDAITWKNYTDEKLWKRTRKWGEMNQNGERVIYRSFQNVIEQGEITIGEITNANNTVSLTVEMTSMPNVIQKATQLVNEFQSIGGTIGKRDDTPAKPKESMLSTPKPEGFGAFS